VIDGLRAAGSALVVEGGEAVASRAEASHDAPPGGWELVQAAGVRVEMIEALGAWRVAFDGGTGGFELEFQAIGDPAHFSPDSDVVRATGMERYEQLCRVRGTVTVAGRGTEVDCLGQRGHAWGDGDRDGIAAARSLGVWLEDGAGLVMETARPAGAAGHDVEAISAFLFDAERPEPVAVADPRLSIEYGPDGQARRAGLELWVSEEDDYPIRVAGAVAFRSTLPHDGHELECAFVDWSVDGRKGVGSYEVVRPVP
jgi:hypothetical protein